jgi:hypothetical protein
MNRIGKWLFLLAIAMTVSLVPGLECFEENDCEFLCDDD